MQTKEYPVFSTYLPWLACQMLTNIMLISKREVRIFSLL